MSSIICERCWQDASEVKEKVRDTCTRKFGKGKGGIKEARFGEGASSGTVSEVRTDRAGVDIEDSTLAQLITMPEVGE